MAGNSIVLEIAKKYSINIGWKIWFLGAIMPGIINLILLPIILYFIIKPKKIKNEKLFNNFNIDKENKKFTTKEIKLIIVFVLLIFLWYNAGYINVHIITINLLGFVLQIIS